MNSDPTPTDGQSTPPPTTEVAVAAPKKSHHKKKAPKRHVALDMLQARDTLGMSPEWWETTKIAAYEVFGQFMDVPRARNTLMVRGFDCLDQVAVALRVSSEIANNECYPAETRLLGVKMVALTTEAQVKMQEHLMLLSEKGAQKADALKKRNLPPTALAAQVNIFPAGHNGNGQMRVASATTGQKETQAITVGEPPPVSLPADQ